MSNAMKTAFTSGKIQTGMPAYNDPKKKGNSSGEVRHENKIENMEHMPKKGKKGY